MRIFLIGLMLLASSGAWAGAPSTGDSDPDWVKLPNPEDLQAVWPKEAFRRGQGGMGVIQCKVTPEGLLDQCKVISEAPRGSGFGQAALLAAPSFAMKPPMHDGKPVWGAVRVPVRFAMPAVGLMYEQIAMISDPVWETAPSFADMAAVWPKGNKLPFAHISMRCRFTREGRLRDCDILTENPRGEGFGSAARELSRKFKLRVSPQAAADISKAYVNLPIHFINPTAGEHSVVQPKWITGLDPAKAQAIFPARAADAGVTTGRGFADCAVAADGQLTDCKPSGAEPEGMGFAEAAVQVASIMQMNPWTNGGGPVDGVRIRLPIAFHLAAKPPAPAKP